METGASRVIGLSIVLMTVLGILFAPVLMRVEEETPSHIEEDKLVEITPVGAAFHTNNSSSSYMNVGREVNGTVTEKSPLLDQNRTILCFGDSLTFGTNRQKQLLSPLHPHSYAKRLSILLGRPQVTSDGNGNLKKQEEFTSNNAVVENGWPGEMTNHMWSRLPGAIQSSKDPQVIIILGGTNDIGQGESKERIVANLQSMHYIALNGSSSSALVHTIHMTIPPSDAFVNPKYKSRFGDKRLAVNEEMRKFIHDHNKRHAVVRGEVGSIFLVDLEYIYLPIESHQTMWNKDLLHFSAEGYDGIADLIYRAMLVYGIIWKKTR